MDLWFGLKFMLQDVGDRLLSITSPYSLASYVGALAVFAACCLLSPRFRHVGWPRFLRAAFPRRILRHRSTCVDIRMYILNFAFLPAIYGMAIISTPAWESASRNALTAAFGQHQALDVPLWLVLAVTTVAEVAMIDFGYWFSHWLMHRIPALWEFHKVHHSAEVMSPLTEWRQHPLELVLIPNAIALSHGTTFGALGYLFGSAQPLTLWQLNVLLLVFFLTISHLRHSHVWLPFTGLAGRIVHSPAHHQIHHSTEPRHHGKNLGFALSIWDWLFGTLWIPGRNERVSFGLGEESADFDSIGKSFLMPFAKAAARLRPCPVGADDEKVEALPRAPGQ